MEQYFLSRTPNPSDGEAQLASYLAYHLETVLLSNETEIAKGNPTRHLWLFRKPKEIRTIGELREYTRNSLVDSNWNSLRIIAETGAWLLEKPFFDALLERFTKKKFTKVEIIVRTEHVPIGLGPNVDQIQNVFNGHFGNACKFIIRRIAWWKRNRHLTLFLDDKEPRRGIYFRRRLETPVIRPVILGDAYDLAVLGEIFERYLRKADQEEGIRKEQNV
jgi:hypothetical protein